MERTETSEISFMLHRLHWMTMQFADHALQEQLELGFAQFKILKVVHYHEGTTGSIIAKHLNQTQAAVSRQIDHLVKAGYIERRENEQNRREHILVLTAAGVAATKQAQKLLNTWSAELFSSFTETERQTFARLTTKLYSQAESESKKINPQHN
jgi:DNA-binding MarR family transcriptional regulator